MTREGEDGGPPEVVDTEEKSVEKPTEPPVVARLVVEIRSDGSHTIARGALEDGTVGQRVAVQAEGRTPLELVAQLAKALLSAPALARRSEEERGQPRRSLTRALLRALLPGPTTKRR